MLQHKSVVISSSLLLSASQSSPYHSYHEFARVATDVGPHPTFYQPLQLGAAESHLDVIPVKPAHLIVAYLYLSFISPASPKLHSAQIEAIETHSSCPVCFASILRQHNFIMDIS